MRTFIERDDFSVHRLDMGTIPMLGLAIVQGKMVIMGTNEALSRLKAKEINPILDAVKEMLNE